MLQVDKVVSIISSFHKPSGKRESHIQVLLLLAFVRATIGCSGDASPATTSAAIVRGSSRLWNRRDVSQRKMPQLLSGKVGHEFNVTTDGANAAKGHTLDPTLDANRATPPVWRSTLCMEQWGMSVFQEEPDPNGYVIYVNGRYHRILDLGAFRSLISRGRIQADQFVTVLSGRAEYMMRKLKNEQEILHKFTKYVGSQVIVMEDAWKSGFDREPLKYLRPNPFYMGIVRVVLGQQEDWADGNFMTVQWRTEMATGDLMECYEELKERIETHRLSQGMGVHQVMFNTDLEGRTSSTYLASERRGKEIVAQIVRDYPHAFHNTLHKFVHGIEDTGIKAFVAGLAVASSKVMIASSVKSHKASRAPEERRCQKPSSQYVHLIVEWREINEKDPDSVVEAFPIDP